jgi:uridine kinase
MSDALTAGLLEVLHADGHLPPRTRLVIGVAGESGSGKSTLATHLAVGLERAGIPTACVHQDNYFVRSPRVNHANRLRDLASVGPQEVHMAAIEEHIAAFRRGAAAVAAPVVNYPDDRFDSELRDFSAVEVLVVEGTYVLTLSGLDVRVFLEATHQDTHDRRMARNRDYWEPVIDTILGIEHTLIAPQRAVAHYLVDRTFLLRRGPGHHR